MNLSLTNRLPNYYLLSSQESSVPHCYTFLKKQQYVIDVNSLLRDNRGFLPTMYSQDGLHPDISGKKVIADAVIRFLRTFDKI
ncbi:MAG: hypothetical protein H6Q68_2282 [Firmicutes bacterium]|nr:hypothetical protein [Bacillota bacterium]